MKTKFAFLTKSIILILTLSLAFAGCEGITKAPHADTAPQSDAQTVEPQKIFIFESKRSISGTIEEISEPTLYKISIDEKEKSFIENYGKTVYVRFFEAPRYWEVGDTIEVDYFKIVKGKTDGELSTILTPITLSAKDVKRVEDGVYLGTLAPNFNSSNKFIESYGDTVYLKYTGDKEICDGDTIYFTFTESDVSTNDDGKPVVNVFDIEYPREWAKPVIYLYPEESTECSVKLTLDGTISCTYPDHGTDGWQNFVAEPDGTLTFPDGKEYYCLYWEGVGDIEFDFSQGFCVKGSDTAAFLEWALSEQGLTEREANEFIIFWLPIMQKNEYNVISFQTDVYTDAAKLEISPAPDSLLRVYMAFYGSDEPVEIESQSFEKFDRRGFTVVEWGGSAV